MVCIVVIFLAVPPQRGFYKANFLEDPLARHFHDKNPRNTALQSSISQINFPEDHLGRHFHHKYLTNTELEISILQVYLLGGSVERGFGQVSLLKIPPEIGIGHKNFPGGSLWRQRTETSFDFVKKLSKLEGDPKTPARA